MPIQQQWPSGKFTVAMNNKDMLLAHMHIPPFR